MPVEGFLERHFGLDGRVALVTGASGGIGRALAIGLAGAGAHAVLHGRSTVQLSETAEGVRAIGGSCSVVTGDIGEDGACERLIGEVAAACGRIDVLVNCAGINRRKPIAEVSDEDYEAIVAVNMKAVYLLSRAAWRVMKGQGGGKIIHVASLASSMGIATSSVYGMTKAAIAQLAKTQAVEWAADNIQVNCLAPGFIRTPLTEKTLWGDPKRRSWMLGRTPAKRAGAPEDMVSAALLLAGPGSAFLTGQMVTVDGGVLAGGSWDD